MSYRRHEILPRRLYEDPWLERSRFRPITPEYIDDSVDSIDFLEDSGPGWLRETEIIEDDSPFKRVPVNHKFVVDCKTFDEDSIKTEINGNQLVVTAVEKNNPRERFRKVFEIPQNADVFKLQTTFSNDKVLTIEIPLKTILNLQEDIFPKLILNPDGVNTVSMRFTLPHDIDPSKIHVTCNDNELIIRAEECTDKFCVDTHLGFYRRNTLPENTDCSTLECFYNNNQITVTARIDPKANTTTKPIFVEVRK